MKWITNENYLDLPPRKSGLVIGCPKATPDYTVEQLEDMGMVGLYRNKSVDTPIESI